MFRKFLYARFRSLFAWYIWYISLEKKSVRLPSVYVQDHRCIVGNRQGLPFCWRHSSTQRHILRDTRSRTKAVLPYTSWIILFRGCSRGCELWCIVPIRYTRRKKCGRNKSWQARWSPMVGHDLILEEFWRYLHCFIWRVACRPSVLLIPTTHSSSWIAGHSLLNSICLYDWDYSGLKWPYSFPSDTAHIKFLRVGWDFLYLVEFSARRVFLEFMYPFK